jgi:integrase
MKAGKKRRTVTTLGQGESAVKIYTLRTRSGYESYQCCWYDLGRRQTRTFSDRDAAGLFSQQKAVELANGIKKITQATLRDVEVFKSCENRVAPFGTTLAAAFEEWMSAKQGLGAVSLAEAVQYYNRHHAGVIKITLANVLPLFYEAKQAAKVSSIYLRVSRCYLTKFQKRLGPLLMTDVTTQDIERFLREVGGGPVTKNNIRRTIVTLFTWARSQGYLQEDRKTAPEKAATFQVGDEAPAIWTPAEMRKLLSVCPPSILPMLAIGAFSGIRSAEIDRLEWQEVLWDRSFIEIKGRKAKTKSRRLVPLRDNLKAWLLPFRKEEGFVCHLPNHSVRLNYVGEKAGFGWRQNALRHSYASYRLAEIQDAARVALELGNSPEKLFKHYRELVAPEAATDWFSIFPPASWDGNRRISPRKTLATREQ